MLPIEKGFFVSEKQTLGEFFRNNFPDDEMNIVAGILDDKICGLQTEVFGNHVIRPIFLQSEIGQRIYRRSVVFILIIAVHKLFDNAEVVVRFTANKGLYCDVSLKDGVLSAEHITQIRNEMKKIVSENIPITKKHLEKDKAIQLFKETKQIAKVNLINSLKLDKVSIYYCGKYYDYFYGTMLDNTGRLGKFEIDFEEPGLLLRTPAGGDEPSAKIKQPKLKYILTESKKWAGILHCGYISDLNRFIKQNRITDIIRVSEALHEKWISNIADDIAENIDRSRLIMIAGPSSSGKTSFTQRLKVQLRVWGLEPVSLSLDDYFLERVKSPKTADGQYDYEALGALDLELINDHLVKLLDGEPIMHPKYDFISGERELDAVGPVILPPGQPLLIEGIHGLNEKLTSAIPRNKKYKIYVSALTQLNIDQHNRIPSTDARMIRRLVRDYQFRGAGGLKTLEQWPIVRAGEERNIFPFQEDADTVFNSALLYELPVLKKYAVSILKDIPDDSEYHWIIQNILDKLSFFEAIEDEDEIPHNSILREFIGNSCFFKADGDLKE